MEDLALVIGMNRLRAAYVELDPGIERYLVTSAHDDNGLWQTYNHLAGPRPTMQPLASSGTFIMLVNSSLTGVFAALVALALRAPGPLVGIVAATGALSFLAISVRLGMRQFQRVRRRHVPLFPAPDAAGTGSGDSQAVAQEARA